MERGFYRRHDALGHRVFDETVVDCDDRDAASEQRLDADESVHEFFFTVLPTAAVNDKNATRGEVVGARVRIEMGSDRGEWLRLEGLMFEF